MTIREHLEAIRDKLEGAPFDDLGCYQHAVAALDDLDNAEQLMDYPGYRLVPDPVAAATPPDVWTAPESGTYEIRGKKLSPPSGT